MKARAGRVRGADPSRGARAPALSVALILAGCGTTHLIADTPGAAIYVDGRLVGRGRATVTRIGRPAEMEVRAVSGGREVTQVVDREFTGTTLLLGFVSVYTGFYWGWSYPNTVWLKVKGAPSLEGGDPWTRGTMEADADPWMRPGG